MSALEREIDRLQREKGIFEERIQQLDNQYQFNEPKLLQKMEHGSMEPHSREIRIWFDEFSLKQSDQRDLEETESLYEQLRECQCVPTDYSSFNC